MSGKNFRHIASLFAEIICKYYALCILFCQGHSIGPVNACANLEINRYKIYEFRKHTKDRMVYLASSDAKTVRCIGWDTILICISTRNILKPTRSIYDFRFKSWFSCFWWPWPFTYVLVVTDSRHEVLESPCEVS